MFHILKKSIAYTYSKGSILNLQAFVTIMNSWVGAVYRSSGSCDDNMSMIKWMKITFLCSAWGGWGHTRVIIKWILSGTNPVFILISYHQTWIVMDDRSLQNLENFIVVFLFLFQFPCFWHKSNKKPGTFGLGYLL